MSRERTRAVLRDCLRQFRIPACLYVIFAAVCLAVFLLYGLPAEPFCYAFVVAGFCLLAFFAAAFLKAQRRAAARQALLTGVCTEWKTPPAPETLTEADYTQMLETLGAETEALAAAFEREQRETQDFYTAWVHQIKTPIAVMKLALGAEEAPDRRALGEELFRIEQYTDMVLAYQRLGSSVNDLVIEEYALDALIREVIRKFAPQFIYKKLKLDYAGTDARVVLDKKWFLCMLEQLVSNAIKYTAAGTVTIAMEHGVLSVSDTGVGIAPEDLPRIFEKGYTGANGRLNDRSSGLGLYLCGKAANLLNIPVRAESSPGEGSRFSLDLTEKLVKTA